MIVRDFLLVYIVEFPAYIVETMETRDRSGNKIHMELSMRYIYGYILIPRSGALVLILRDNKFTLNLFAASTRKCTEYT